MKNHNESISKSIIKRQQAKKYLFVALIFTCLIFAMLFSACDTAITLYFTSPQYYIFLDQQTQITPNVICKPKNKGYSLISTNTSILTVADDGISVIGLREGSIILKANSGDFNANTRVLVFKTSDSSAISTTIDDKVNVYFITEAGSFAAQKLNPGEKAVDPSDEYHRGGYTLFGWYEDQEYQKKFDFKNTPITKNISLYALWGIDTPEFKFKTIDGRTYINGLFHKYLPYPNIAFPTHDTAGNLIFGITEYSFTENQNIISIAIPTGYETIGKGAFSNCQNLQTVVIEDGIIDIEEEAFYKNIALENVVISGNSLLQIKNSAFEGCTLLSNLSLPDSLLQIGPSAFQDCTALQSFETPENLLKLYNYAFMSSGLVSIDLKNIEEIGTQAFWSCLNLETVTGGEQLKDLGSYIFGSYLNQYQSSSTKWLRDMLKDERYDVKDTKLLYICDALIYAYPGQIKPEFELKESTRVIAGECFADVPNSTVKFRGYSPPTFIGRYAFGVNSSDESTLDIVVPRPFISDYIDAFLVTTEDPILGILPTKYSFSVVRRMYEDWGAEEIPAMRIYRRKKIDWVDSEFGVWGFSTSDTKTYLLIGGYDKKISSVMPKILNVKEATDKIANYEQYVVDRVKAYAFNSDTNVEEIILPLYITYIEEGAFSTLSSCTKISFKGGFEWTSGTTIEKNSFNFTQMPNCKLYVPAENLTQYKTIWNYSTMAGRLFAIES